MSVEGAIAILLSFAGLGTALWSARIANQANRKVDEIKSLDLAHELGLKQSELRARWTHLKTLHETAWNERRSVLSMMGSFHTGSANLAESEWEQDDALLKEDSELYARYQSAHADIDEDPKALSARTIKVNDLLNEVNAMVAKYEEWDDWNREWRDTVKQERLADRSSRRSSYEP